MALRRFFLPILIAVLLFSQVLARELEDKPAADEKRVAVKVQDPSLKADEGELDASSLDEDEADNFDDDKHYRYRHGYRYKHGYRYHHGPRHGYRRPPHCRFYCGQRCCSAKEYAEFVQDEN